VVNRRRALESATTRSAFASSARRNPGREPSAAAPSGVLVDDVHSKLNATFVSRVAPVDSLEAVRAVVLDARRSGQSISIAGGRHSMGGQQFGAGTVLLDTRPMHRVLAFDRKRGRIEVEAGIEWPELIGWLVRAQEGQDGAWGIAQKQTGADRLSIGGALASNIHGRGLRFEPLAADIESLVLVDARGHVARCSREQNADRFRLALGGYGLFGVVHSVCLRLVPRVLLERVVEVRGIERLAEAFQARIRDGFTYGDFQFETDERSETFLTRGVFACYRPAAADAVIDPDQRELTSDDWLELLRLAHVDKARAFERYSQHYLATDGQHYRSDTQQLGYYCDDYHTELDRLARATVAGTEMISELYVPRDALEGFLRAAAVELREQRANVIYGTVRLIERDRTSFLTWAREPWACVVFNLHVDHDAAGIERARRAFRTLIELARERGGSYYLTYHRWATREQVEACHPNIVEFLQRKIEHDPDQLFQSEWWRHYRTMFADSL
jgi:FAD/FMN-containing dehydrogenase